MTLPVSALSSSGETTMAAGAVPVSAPPRQSGGRGLSPQSSLKKWSRRSPPEIRDGTQHVTYRVTNQASKNLPLTRAFEHSGSLECNPQSKSKIGGSFGLHSGVALWSWSAIQISIQNKPEFWTQSMECQSKCPAWNSAT